MSSTRVVALFATKSAQLYHTASFVRRYILQNWSRLTICIVSVDDICVGDRGRRKISREGGRRIKSRSTEDRDELAVDMATSTGAGGR
jgi:hypothetical protein